MKSGADCVSEKTAELKDNQQLFWELDIGDYISVNRFFN